MCPSYTCTYMHIYIFPMHLNTYRHAHAIFYLLDIEINISIERYIEKEFRVYV